MNGPVSIFASQTNFIKYNNSQTQTLVYLKHINNNELTAMYKCDRDLSMKESGRKPNTIQILIPLLV